MLPKTTTGKAPARSVAAMAAILMAGCIPDIPAKPPLMGAADAPASDTGADTASDAASLADEGLTDVSATTDLEDVDVPVLPDPGPPEVTPPSDPGVKETETTDDGGVITCTKDEECLSQLAGVCTLAHCVDGACQSYAAPDQFPCENPFCDTCGCGAKGQCSLVGQGAAPKLVVDTWTLDPSPELFEGDRVAQIVPLSLDHRVVVVDRASAGKAVIYSSEDALAGSNLDAALFPGGSFDDPYLAVAPDGQYRLVAAATAPGSACGASIHMTDSPDLVTWSAPIEVVSCGQAPGIDDVGLSSPTLILGPGKASALYHRAWATNGTATTRVRWANANGAVDTESLTSTLESALPGFSLAGVIHLVRCTGKPEDACWYVITQATEPKAAWISWENCLSGTKGHRSLGLAFVADGVELWTVKGDGASAQMFHARVSTLDGANYKNDCQ